MYLVLSTSLHPNSKSRILANAAFNEVKDQGGECELIDLAYIDPLPFCNGHDCYSNPVVGELAGKIAGARGILIASPVYNYDVSASCKNLIELTGSAWNDKTVGLLCAAGGQGSYMALMPFFNSLMLDFRCLCLPKFVYADETAFSDEALVNNSIVERVDELARTMVKVVSALQA